ncbi:MAG: hypothetical protein WA609_02050 [Terriglobales bacterium]
MKYPQGFEESVGFVHDVPVMFQLTGCADTFWKVREKLIGKFNPAAPMGLSPLLVPITVIAGQFNTHGPLPPFAHPPSNVRLKRAAANSSFFTMIEVFSLKPPLPRWLPDLLARPAGLFRSLPYSSAV